MPLEPLICRSRYKNVKKSYKNQRKFGESENIHIFAVSKKTRVLTVPSGTLKTEKLWKKLHLSQNLETKQTTKEFGLQLERQQLAKRSKKPKKHAKQTT